MKLYTALIILAYLGVIDCYTKYGRTCKDIGCPNNQICVMETDPCSYYQRQGECGSFPTCKRTTNTERSCSSYVCPPTKVCKMDGGTPKCVDDHSKVGHVGYNTQNQNNLAAGADTSGSSGQVYPSLPKGETTPRPNVYQQPVGGSGYHGGAIGSGYPGQGGSGYRPAQTGGYPQQSGGYPQQAGGYPQQAGGYPQQTGRNGYPQQGGYYPGHQGGYQQGSYPGGYYQQNGYQQRYGSNSSPSFSDQITNSIKSIGLFCVLISFFVSRIYSGL